MPCISKTEKWAAYHEAGHAVISLEMEIPFSSVAIFPAKDDSRRWGGEVSPVTGHRSRMDRTQEMYYAGWIAEGRARGCRYFVASLHAEDDIENARARFLGMCVHPPTKEQEWVHWASVERTVKRLVKEHWPEITAVAEELLNKKTLTMAQVQGIISEKKGGGA
jgi:ATP-dependent Zn protease